MFRISRLVGIVVSIALLIGCGSDTKPGPNLPDSGMVDMGMADTDRDTGEVDMAVDPCDIPTVITSEDVSGGATLVAGCYLAESSLTVDAGRLSIEPDVTILFARNTSLTIAGRDGGSILASGEEDEPILFTGVEETAGFWRGVYFDNSEDPDNALNYVTIEFGGGAEFGSGLGQANLAVGGFVGESQLSVTNSTFRDSAGHGIELEAGDQFTSFGNNTFEGNADYALSIPAEQRRHVDSESSFVGEGAQAGVEVFGGSVRTDATWQALDGEAFTAVTDDVVVQATLTVEAGAEFRFADNLSLVVDGRDDGVLLTEGSSEMPVIFSGLEQNPGAWRGIYLDNSNDTPNSIDHTIVEYGGSSEVGSGLGRSNLAIGGFVGDTALSITNSTFRFSEGHGTELEEDSVFTNFESNSFEGNLDYALSVPASLRDAIDATSTFTGDEAIAFVEIFGGVVEQDAVWPALDEGARTAVTGNIEVRARLEIEPGVELNFGDDVEFRVSGRDDGILVARGTEDEQIVMSSLEGVKWRGIYIDNSTSSQNAIEYATIDNGGFNEIAGEKANLNIGGFVGSSRIEVRNCTISNSDGVGIFVDADSVDGVNDDIDTVNTFLNNAAGDLVLEN